MEKRIKKIWDTLEKNGIESEFLEIKKMDHVLVNGDCSEIIKSIPSGSVDLVITDPPYNKGLDYGRFNDSKSWKDYYDWLKKSLEGIPRILSDKGSFYLISYPEINARILPYIEDELRLKYRRWITWHYPTNIGHSKKNYTRSQRSILFFTKNQNDYTFNREKLVQHYKNPTAPVIRKRIAEGSKGRTSYDLLRLLDLMELQKGLIDTIDIDLLKNNSKDRFRNLKGKFKPMESQELKKKDHPCQLPLGLLELFVKVSSNKGDVVFDPFAGTFTTSVAAGKNGRNSLGVELNKKFMKFGHERIKTI
ncbi:hypothetical protein JW899_02985 [Candidatus Uhrbacteria bacterium]|nr:hypothetical protein [Candidatus Uhrbacteria bacterium]